MTSETSTISADQSVEDLRRELAEAREQQSATAEILRVISSSPMDLPRVFSEMATSAARLCNANDAQIRQVDGTTLRLVAQHGSIPSYPELKATRGLVSGRAVLERRTIQVTDLDAEPDEYPEGSAHARRLGYRTMLAVPLIRAGAATGVINIRRMEARPFSDKQIALLQIFADQAVIAIENTRLFEAEQARTRELTEALEQQIATSKVLEIISSSTGELQRVFKTLLENGTRLSQGQLRQSVPSGGQRLLSARRHPQRAVAMGCLVATHTRCSSSHAIPPRPVPQQRDSSRCQSRIGATLH
jgi:two-component system, NtrC family, sensor kinase